MVAEFQHTHGPINVSDMHGTGTEYIVHHSQKSMVQWSGVAKFICIYIDIDKDRSMDI